MTRISNRPQMAAAITASTSETIMLILAVETAATMLSVAWSAERRFQSIRPLRFLRPSAQAGATADGVVLVTEPGRCLDRRDVTDVLSLPVLAEVELDPAVARSVDAGLLTRRSHRVLERSLRELW